MRAMRAAGTAQAVRRRPSRFVAAVAACTLGLGGVASAAGLPSAGGAGPTRTGLRDVPRRTAGAALPTGWKLVTFQRAAVAVPASWPVVDLRTDPDHCVTYDHHAVYLGVATAPRCPAHLVGRTDTITLTSAGGHLAHTVAATVDGRAAEVSYAPAGGATVAVPGLGVEVTMTWATDDRADLRILSTLRSAATVPPAPAATPAVLPGPRTLPSIAALARSAVRLTGTRPSGPEGRAAAGASTSSGFDTCTAPSLSTMRAWLRSPYRTVSIYLGGSDLACAQPALTPDWVIETHALGWDFLPTWVGLQAPCTTAVGDARITASDAVTAGATEARDAAASAEALGFGAGTPLSLDMEPFPTTDPACVSTVQAYFNAWDRTVDAAHFTSAIYLNAGYGFAALGDAYGQASFVEPTDIDLADWDGVDSVYFRSAPAGAWADHQRLHQYLGDKTETWGGATDTVDVSDVQAAVGAPSAEAPPVDIARNPDFAVGLSDWHVRSATSATVARAGAVRPPAGRRYLAVAVVRHAGGGVYQDIPTAVTAGTTYCAAVAVAAELTRGRTGSGRLTLQARRWTGGPTVAGSAVAVGTPLRVGGWRTVRACVTATHPASDLRVEIDPAVGPRIGIDAVTVQRSLTADGDFNASTAGWTALAGTAMALRRPDAATSRRPGATAPYEGSGYLEMATRRRGGGIEQNVTWEVGRDSRWCVSAAVVGDDTLGAGGRLTLSLLGDGAEERTVAFGPLTDGNGWSTVTACLTARRTHDGVEVVVAPRPDGRDLAVDAVDLH
jgi:hypothetical protein